VFWEALTRSEKKARQTKFVQHWRSLYEELPSNPLNRPQYPETDPVSASRLISELAVRCGFGIYANVLVLASLFNKEPL
jgi:hypothetical protein